MRPIRIGCGAGYAGDRIEPAIELAERGDLHYLVFECLAERTIALAQQARARDPKAGFDPMLIDRMAAVPPIRSAPPQPFAIWPTGWASVTSTWRRLPAMMCSR